jgi:hypothetical protein
MSGCLPQTDCARVMAMSYPIHDRLVPFIGTGAAMTLGAGGAAVALYW